MSQRRPRTGEPFPMPTSDEKAQQISNLRQMASMLREITLVPQLASELRVFTCDEVMPHPVDNEDTWDGLLWWSNAVRHHGGHRVGSPLHKEFAYISRIFNLTAKYKWRDLSSKEIADTKAEIEERAAAIENICDRLEAICCPDIMQSKAMAYLHTEPKVYLTNWPEILEALGLKAKDEASKAKVRAAHDKFQSPIIFGSQGTQPFVERAKLLAWWNSLESRYQELHGKSRDANATVAEQYEYGRDSVVVPDLNGSVKKRRSNRKAT